MDVGYLTPLALLGHPLRARLLRLLVRRLPHGMTAGEIAQALEVPPSTLSAHLGALAAAGVLDLRCCGAMRLYRAAPSRLADALSRVAEDLCLGRAGDVGPLLRKPLTLLFLCDDNASLSLMAEALARRRLAGRVFAASGGLSPAGQPDPLTRALLARRGHDLGPLLPKPAAGRAADLVIALSEKAAEAQPLCTGALCAFWPLVVAPEDGRLIPRAIALHAAYRALNTRISALRQLSLATLPRGALQAALDDLSSGLPAGGRVCGSLPEPRRTWSSPAPPASAAS